jgi:hypothetical protein
MPSDGRIAARHCELDILRDRLQLTERDSVRVTPLKHWEGPVIGRSRLSRRLVDETDLSGCFPKSPRRTPDPDPSLAKIGSGHSPRMLKTEKRPLAVQIRYIGLGGSFAVRKRSFNDSFEL